MKRKHTSMFAKTGFPVHVVEQSEYAAYIFKRIYIHIIYMYTYVNLQKIASATYHTVTVEPERVRPFGGSDVGWRCWFVW